MYLASAFIHSERTKHYGTKLTKKKRKRRGKSSKRRRRAKSYKFCLETSNLCDIHIEPSPAVHVDEHIEDEDIAKSDSQPIAERQVFKRIRFQRRSRNSYDEEDEEKEEQIDDDVFTKNGYNDRDTNEYSEMSQTQNEGRERSKSGNTTLHFDINAEHEKLKQKYLELQRQNEVLLARLRQYETSITRRQTTTTTNGYFDFEEHDILRQLVADLKCLHGGINFDVSARSEYERCQIRMDGMCEPLSDLALDFESEVLQNALNSIREAVGKIYNLGQAGLYDHGLLIDVIQTNIGQIEQMLNCHVTKEDDDEFILLSSQSMITTKVNYIQLQSVFVYYDRRI